MKSPFTNLGSNIAPDDDRNQAVDREREAADTNTLTPETDKAEFFVSTTERQSPDEGIMVVPSSVARKFEREAAELAGGGIAFLEKSERELIGLLIEFYHCPCHEIHDAINEVPESTFNKLRESIK